MKSATGLGIVTAPFTLRLGGLAEAQTAADSAGIRAAALDYIEGWYTADVPRMTRALHPDLVKRIVETDPKSQKSVLGQMGAKELIEYVSILDIYQGAASAKVIAADRAKLARSSNLDHQIQRLISGHDGVSALRAIP